MIKGRSDRLSTRPSAPAWIARTALFAVLVCAARAQDVRARLDAEPAHAALGEPVEWVLAIEHPAAVSIRPAAEDPCPDDAWVLLDERRTTRTALPDDPARARTLVRWRVMALEPGAHALPALAVEFEQDGETHTVQAQAGTLAIAAALAPDEDAPRAARGFHPPPADAHGRALWPWLAAGLSALAVLAWFLVRRRRAQVARARPPSALEVLALLEARLAQEGEECGRPLVYELSRLVRGTLDAWRGAELAAATDEDWIARVEADERVPLAVRTGSARLMHSAQAVKYALHRPTRFALAEMLAEGRAVLEALAATPPLPSAAPQRMEAAA